LKTTAVIANGKPAEAKLPSTIEEFLVAQKLWPGSTARDNLNEPR
jgi:hypothetical protein